MSAKLNFFKTVAASTIVGLMTGCQPNQNQDYKTYVISDSVGTIVTPVTYHKEVKFNPDSLTNDALHKLSLQARP